MPAREEEATTKTTEAASSSTRKTTSARATKKSPAKRTAAAKKAGARKSTTKRTAKKAAKKTTVAKRAKRAVKRVRRLPRSHRRRRPLRARAPRRRPRARQRPRRAPPKRTAKKTVRKAAAKKGAAKRTAKKTVRKAAAKKAAAKRTAKKTAKKSTARKSTARKTTAKRTAKKTARQVDGPQGRGQALASTHEGGPPPLGAALLGRPRGVDRPGGDRLSGVRPSGDSAQSSLHLGSLSHSSVRFGPRCARRRPPRPGAVGPHPVLVGASGALLHGLVLEAEVPLVAVIAHGSSIPPHLDSCTMSTLVPGVLSPVLPVPATIERPEYVGRPRPARYTGPEVKDADTIERMRVAGRIAAQALAEVGRHVAPGSDDRRAGPGGPRVPLSTTAPTPRHSATRASPSRCARRSTR